VVLVNRDLTSAQPVPARLLTEFGLAAHAALEPGDGDLIDLGL
jgi:hypothetical protein